MFYIIFIVSTIIGMSIYDGKLSLSKNTSMKNSPQLETETEERNLARLYRIRADLDGFH